MQDQFAALGVSVEIDEDETETDVVEVWDTNWPALLAFLACETQWRAVARGMTGVMTFLGLDYAAAETVLRQQDAPAGTFDDLRQIEAGALEAYDEIEADD